MEPPNTSMPRLVVRPAVPSEFSRVLPVCVEAFADEAVSAWVEPEPELRHERTRELFETSLRAAVDAGQLLVAFLPGGDPVAASVWTELDSTLPTAELPATESIATESFATEPFPTESPAAERPTAEPPTGETPAGQTPASRPSTGQTPAAESAALFEQDRPATRRLAAVLAATSARHPDVPHLHLSAMAALPRRRGLGAGSAMLRHGLDRARELGLPVYLEASTPRNRRLYARHGFHDLGEPIHLPEDGPVLQPMWRTHDGPTAAGAPA